MAQKAICYVTNAPEGKGAFAVRKDNDETVYIPSGVADILDVQEMDTLEVVVIKNNHGGAPWLAIRARIVDETR